VSGAELGISESGLGIRGRGGYERLVGSGLLPTAFRLLPCIYHLRPTRLKLVMYNNEDMAKHVTDMSEAEATRDFASLLARVREGAEVVIKDGTRPVSVVRPAEPHIRLLSESLRLAREHGSTATPDENFAEDVAAAIESHREPLKPPAWD